MNIKLETLINTIVIWISTNGLKIIIDLILLWIAFKIISLIVKKTIRILHKRNVDKSLVLFLEAFLETALKILAIIIFLEFIGIGTASLAALVASAGIAVGLALKGSLSNFAGGIILLLLRPIKVGDSIESNSNSGTVERIHIFYTEIVSGDNKQILIPNGKLLDNVIVNSSIKNTRRVDLNFVISDDKDILKVKNILNDLIEKNNNILKNPTPLVAVDSQGGGSVSFIVKLWCNKDDYWKLYYEMMEKVNLKFKEENILSK